MSKSPFYKTGISRSPLFDKGHGSDNKSHIHATKKNLKGKVTERKTISTTPITKEEFFSSPAEKTKKSPSSKPLKMNEGSPLYDTTHGKKGHAHPHTLKEYRAKRKGEIDKMQAKLNTLEEGTSAFNKQADKIDAHDLETTKKVRNIQ